MTVYLDSMGHLLPDPEQPDLEELHELAQSIGLKRSWFQDSSPEWCPHYDVMGYRKKDAACAAGAVWIGARDWMRRFQRAREIPA